MRAIPEKLNQINGSGWLVGLIVNVVWTTLLMAGAYWKIHESIALLQQQSAQVVTQSAELRDTVRLDMVTRKEFADYILLDNEKRERVLYMVREEVRHHKAWDSMQSEPK